MPTHREERGELSAEGSAGTISDNVNTLSVLADPSADSSSPLSQSTVTSKLSLLTQLSNRSGQAVNGEGCTPICVFNQPVGCLVILNRVNALSVLAGPRPERLLHLMKKATLEMVDK